MPQGQWEQRFRLTLFGDFFSDHCRTPFTDWSGRPSEAPGMRSPVITIAVCNYCHEILLLFSGREANDRRAVE